MGLSQVLLTILGAWLALLVRPHATGPGLGAGLARRAGAGCLMAMSSTAIVVKLMAERLELESPHGRRVMGVLLFQDLAVVPLLVLIPAPRRQHGDLAAALAGRAQGHRVAGPVLLVAGSA